MIFSWNNGNEFWLVHVFCIVNHILCSGRYTQVHTQIITCWHASFLCLPYKHTHTPPGAPPDLLVYSQHTKAVIIHSNVSWWETEAQIWSNMSPQQPPGLYHLIQLTKNRSATNTYVWAGTVCRDVQWQEKGQSTGFHILHSFCKMNAESIVQQWYTSGIKSHYVGWG